MDNILENEQENTNFVSTKHTPTAAIILADGFEQIEMVVTHDILVRAGFKVDLIGINHKINYLGNCGLVVQSTRVLEHTKKFEYDVIIIPGGSATEEIADCEELKPHIVDQIHNKKIVAAICAAPYVVLAKWNLLKNHNATCYPTMKEKMRPLVKNFVDSDVVVSENIITSQSVGTALLFAHTIVSEALNLEKAQQISSDTCFDLDLNSIK